MNKRLEYLDIIRVVACLMVIVMHAPISGDGAMTHGPFLVFTSYLTAPLCTFVLYGKRSFTATM